MVVTWAKIRLVNRLNGIKIQKLQLIATEQNLTIVEIVEPIHELI